jgi:hypothetical protein
MSSVYTELLLKNSNTQFKMDMERPGPGLEAHAYNPSYSRERDQEDQGLRPAQ